MKTGLTKKLGINYMRTFLLILILILNIQSWTNAEDIKDFEIEGISIGDSLLNFMTEGEIKKKSSDTYYYKDNKYVYYFFPSLDFLTTYESLQVTVKPKDKKYLIEGIDGVIRYRDIKECNKKLAEIKNELENVFGIDAIFDEGEHPGYKNSTYTRYNFYLSDGKVDCVCFDMSQKFENQGKLDSLYISISSKDFNQFITYENY